MRDNYTETLEKQNEELKQRLAEAEPWVPHWEQDQYDGWHYKSVYFHYGHIRSSAKTVHVLTTILQPGKNDFFPTLEEAKQYLEALATKDSPWNTSHN